MHCLDLPLLLFWEVIPFYRNYEQDNTMRNMLSEQFYMLRRTNTVFHHIHQGVLIVHDNWNTPMEERGCRTPKFDKASPKGMPHTTWEVKSLVKLLHDDYGPYYDCVLQYWHTSSYGRYTILLGELWRASGTMPCITL